MKKIVLLLASIVLAITMVIGCQSQTPTPTPAEPDAPAPAEPDAPAPAEPAAPEDAGGSGQMKKIAVVHYLQAWQMYQIMTDFLQETCDEQGIELVIVDANLDANKQLQLIETMMNSGVDGIFCVTLDGPTLEDVAARCAEQGIAFTSLFTEVKNASGNMFVDEFDYGYQIGKMGALYMADNFPGERVEVGLLRMHDYLPGIERGQGMEAAVAEFFPTGVVVNDQHSVDVASAMSATEAILAGNPETRLFLTDSDDTGAIGAYEALRARVSPEDQHKYAVIGADGTMQAFGYIAEGGMYRGTVALDMKAIADMAFNMTAAAFKGEPYEKIQYVEYVLVDINNVNEWIAKYEDIMG